MWEWDPALHVYRDGGSVIGADELGDLRDQFATVYGAAGSELLNTLVSAGTAVADILPVFAGWILDGHMAMALLAGGGALSLRSKAVDMVMAAARSEISYFASFLRELFDPVLPLSPEAAMARVPLYAGAMVETFERSAAMAWGDSIDLPFYPADGGTQCRRNCRCRWEIREDPLAWVAVWHTERDKKVCKGCKARGDQYPADAPYVQSKPMIGGF